MFPITILDNFFDNPNLIRDRALECSFVKKVNSNFPGVRSDMLEDLNSQLYFQFKEKLCNMLSIDSVNSIDLLAYFQLIPEHYEEGWIHKDHGTNFAGVVYLTPNAPLNCGTAIYKEKNSNENYNFDNRDIFYSGKPIDMFEYRHTRNLHNNKFNQTLEINNVYNRILIYDGNYYHRECGFFGRDKQSNRLTLVFFAKFK